MTKPRRPVEGFVVESLDGCGRSVSLAYFRRRSVNMAVRIRCRWCGRLSRRRRVPSVFFVSRWIGCRHNRRPVVKTVVRGVYRLHQPQPHRERPPTGGTSVRIRGRRRPGGGNVRHGGLTAVEHTEGGRTTSVSGAATDVCPRASHGIRDATDCSPFRRPSTDTGSPDITGSRIPRIISTWSRLFQD